MTQEVAKGLLEADFTTAEELFKVSFDLAVVSDSLDPGDRLQTPNWHAIQTLGEIRHYAGKQTSATGEFKLSALAHKLETSQGEGYGMLKQGAQDCLRHIGSSMSFEDGASLDKIDRPFVELMINSAAEDTYIRADHLRRFGGFIADPVLQRQLAKKIRAVEIRDRKQEVASSVTAKLAREILSSS
jgi:hypothetical protein